MLTFISKLLFNEFREIAASISKDGIDRTKTNSKGYNGHVSAREFTDENRPEDFSQSTIIINGGYVVWELEVDKRIRKNLVDMTLKIETIRTHGMLHTPIKGKSASVFINDKLLDKIYLVKPHPHGEDFGIDSRRPFPVFNYIDINQSIQCIRIEVDDETCWNIDLIKLEPIISRKILKPVITWIIGTIFGAIFSAIISNLFS